MNSRIFLIKSLTTNQSFIKIGMSDKYIKVEQKLDEPTIEKVKWGVDMFKNGKTPEKEWLGTYETINNYSKFSLKFPLIH